MARFQVLGLDGDRELIRSLGRRLAASDAGASRLRDSVRRAISKNRRRAAFSLPYAARLWSAPNWISNARRGILEKPAGKKRRELERWFSGPEGPRSLFAGRILSFDENAAMLWARLMADGTSKGRPRSPLDMIIAAIADVNECVIVTEDERDFAGLKVVNPMRPKLMPVSGSPSSFR